MEIDKSQITSIRSALRSLQYIQTSLLDITVSVSHQYGVLTAGICDTLDTVEPFAETVDVMHSLVDQLRENMGWVTLTETSGKRKRSSKSKQNKRRLFVTSIDQDSDIKEEANSVPKIIKIQETLKLPLILQAGTDSPGSSGTVTRLRQLPATVAQGTADDTQIATDDHDYHVLGEDKYRESNIENESMESKDQTFEVNITPDKHAGESRTYHEIVTTDGSVSYIEIQTAAESSNLMKIFQCPYCEMTFKTNGNLASHLKTHSVEKPHKCPHCGNGFTHKFNLKTHLRIHTGEKPFKCDVCGKEFKQKVHLQSHQLKHTGEKPHFCEHCQKPFSSKSNLNAHLRIFHTQIIP